MELSAYHLKTAPATLNQQNVLLTSHSPLLVRLCLI